MLASAKVDEPLKLRMKRRGLTHIALYGSSESGTVSVGEEEEPASGFAGRILEGCEIRIRDNEDSGDEEDEKDSSDEQDLDDVEEDDASTGGVDIDYDVR